MATVDRLTGVRTAKAIKAPVLVATTANITLSGEQTIDGVAVVTGNRVLVKDQTDGTKNGIYVVAGGDWARAVDFNKTDDISQGTAVFIAEGSTSALTMQIQTASEPEIGTTSLVFDAWLTSGVSDLGESIVVACSDELSAVSVGTSKVTFRMPFSMTVTEVRAMAVTAPTGAAIIVDINESGTSILSTKLTIDVGTKTSVAAGTPAVISDAALADDAEISVDFDQVGSTIAGSGIKVIITGTRP